MNTNTSPWANPPKLPVELTPTFAAAKAARSRKRADALAVIIPRLQYLLSNPDHIQAGDVYYDSLGNIIFMQRIFHKSHNGLDLVFGEFPDSICFSIRDDRYTREKKMSGHLNCLPISRDPAELLRRQQTRQGSDEFHIMSWKRGEWEERLF